MEQTMIIWRFTDGKLGHENQTSGLVAALGLKRDSRVIDVPIASLPSSPKLLLLALFRRKISDFPSEKPDLIIGAGRATHIPMVVAKSQCGGKSIVLMRPSIPFKLFDLIVAPEHDSVSLNERVIESVGVLNPVQFVENKDQHKGLMLIGGESSHFVWDDARIANQILHIAEHNPQLRWTLTTSRRTPESFLQHIKEVPVEIVPVEETDQKWMQAQFASSGQAWVTPDSVSMIYESLSSGATTKIFSLEPTMRESRVRRGLEALLENDSIITFEKWKQDPTKKQTSRYFNESSRVADFILEHLL